MAGLLGRYVTVLDIVACRAELVPALTRGLLQRGIRVATYGSHDGADAMIEIDVTNCTIRRDQTTETREIVERAGDNTRRREVTEYRAESRLDFRAAYRIIDLSNNSEATSGDLNSEPWAVESSLEDYPDFPSDQLLLGQAHSNAIQMIAPFFLETVEERSLVFFDEDKCGMKFAHGAVAAGDYERALELSLANAEYCRIDPEAKVGSKDVAAANYNVGILYRIMADFESAVEHLARASELDPENDVIAEAIREARSAAAADEELRRVEQEAIDRAEQLREAAAERAESTLTNEDIVEMFEEDLSDEIIIQLIETSEVDFDVSRAEVIELNRRGLSSAVISAMIAAAGSQ
ncbi:MAG: hypothetical protein J4F34_09415 [Gemmatimonadetes bacterium]|nr:hypothetical protein [Gemmatimonadota bacterium]